MAQRHRMSSTFRISAWDPTEHCLISAIGSTAADGLTAGLQGVLTAASPRGHPPARDTTVAVPIRADGQSLTEVFEGLAAALIEEICDASVYFTSVRVDGILRNERGGLTAWGYATGRPSRHAPPAYCGVETAVVNSHPDGAVDLRCYLTRDC